MEKKEFLNAIQEITTNQRLLNHSYTFRFMRICFITIFSYSYLKAVQQLSVLLKEEAISGLDKAVWWTEYVIRHRGAKILQSNVPQLPYYQYYLLDVMATFFFILIVILFIEYKIVKGIIKLIRLKMRDDKSYKLE